MADAPALMPCPFCGNSNLEYYSGTKTLGEAISCECGCSFDGSLAAWNTRATPPASVVEAMEKALRPFAFFNEDNPDEDIQTAWETRYGDRFRDWIDFDDIEAVRAALAALTTWRDAQ